MEVMELYSYLIQGVIASAEMERDANIFLQNHWRTSCPDSIQVSHSQTDGNNKIHILGGVESFLSRQIKGHRIVNVHVNLQSLFQFHEQVM
mgnify:CR=1 FL=1